MMYSKPVIGVTGWKNNGKTTLVTKLVSHFSDKGLSVSTIKHAHHTVDLDVPGRDSYRHREAGAREVLLSTGKRFALMHEYVGEEWPLDVLIDRLGPCDLVIVEGYKRDKHPKIEVFRGAVDTLLLANEEATIIAVASDNVAIESPVPVLDLDDIDAIAGFIKDHLDLRV